LEWVHLHVLGFLLFELCSLLSSLSLCHHRNDIDFAELESESVQNELANTYNKEQFADLIFEFPTEMSSSSYSSSSSSSSSSIFAHSIILSSRSSELRTLIINAGVEGAAPKEGGILRIPINGCSMQLFSILVFVFSLCLIFFL